MLLQIIIGFLALSFILFLLFSKKKKSSKMEYPLTKHEMFLQGSLSLLEELKELNGKLDYSPDSVKLIDELVSKNFKNGESLEGSFFAKHTEYRITPPRFVSPRAEMLQP